MNLLVDVGLSRSRLRPELKVAFAISVVGLLAVAFAVGLHFTKRMALSFEKQGTVVGYRVDRFLKNRKTGHEFKTVKEKAIGNRADGTI